MKKRFFAAIRAGVKTTTLRFWRRPRVRSGSVHLVPGLGRVRVTSAAAVRSEDLTERDARADGFADLAALRAALDLLYPRRQREGRCLYLVRFELLSPLAAAGVRGRPEAVRGPSVLRGHSSPTNNRVK
jgi:hypothetical protein